MKKSLGPKTMLYPTPVCLVGSTDPEGRPNIMTVAWAGICCSKPPCVAVSLREATYSYGNIQARQAFTISIPSEDQVRAADFAGIATGRDQDKFAALGWTAVASDLVDAPYVQECPLVLECKVIHTVPIGLHTQFIGQVLDVKADAGVLDDKDRISVELLRPFSFAPEARNYYRTGTILGPAFSVGRKLV